MFTRRRPETEDRKMADAPDDLGIPMKPARSSGQPATVAPLGRAPTPVPPRVPDQARPAGEAPRPVDTAARPSMGLAGTAPAARNSEADVRKLIVGREISLSGEITSCDKLIVEGSVEANLQNCHDVDIAESGLFKGSATIDEIEVLIRASGRVSGTIRYGQIEIECGGQISGDIQAQSGEDFISDVPGARVAF
jgi:cytoskeletal protein CcmA (bactofilin family)